MDYKVGQTIHFHVRSGKTLMNYPIGSKQPLVQKGTKSVVGQYEVKEHVVNEMGEFVKGVVTEVRDRIK